MTDWWKAFLDLLGAEQYSQHAICISNDPTLMILYVASDLTVWMAYFVIGLALLTKRRVIAELSPAAIGLYGLFILLCGLSHLTMVFTLFSGVYRLDIAVRAATASVSAVTAVYTMTALWGHTDDASD